MALQPRKMAKLNSSTSALQFAAAVTAMSIGTGKRLMRNFHYYSGSEPDRVYSSECMQIYRELRFNLFSLQNLYLDHHESESRSAFKVLLAKQIQDNLEELHRKLLFFEVDEISGLIPVIDRLRSFWAGSVDPEFYDSELPSRIDNQLNSDFSTMEQHLQTLPDCNIS